RSSVWPLRLAADFGVRHLPAAMRTRRPFNIECRFHVLSLHRHPAGMATAPASRRKSMLHADAFIEDIAFAFPQALFFRHRFQILENATLQVEHVLEAHRLQ